MNIQETVAVIATVRAICPAQRFDDRAPQAWHLLLEDVRYADALAVMKTVALRNEFITPKDIYAAVKTLRQERLDKFGHITTSVDGLTVEHDIRERRALRTAIADGNLDRTGYDAYLASGKPYTPENPQLTAAV